MHIIPGKFLLYIAKRDPCSVWVDRDLGSKALRDAMKHKRREARGARRAASVIEVGRKKQAMGLEDDTRSPMIMRYLGFKRSYKPFPNAHTAHALMRACWSEASGISQEKKGTDSFLGAWLLTGTRHPTKNKEIGHGGWDA